MAQQPRQSHSTRRHRRSLSLLGMLLLLGLIGLSASRLTAWVYASNAIRAVTEEDVPLQHAQAALDLALRLWPWDAEYHNQRGLLAVRARDIRAGENAYLQSLKLRPTWPYTWINLAQYWLIRGRSDTFFTTLWKQGLALGPAEDRLHLAFSQIGLSHWYRLNPAQRDLLQQSVAYLVTAANAATSLTELKKYARQQQLQPLLCRLGVRSVNLAEWCERQKNQR